MPKLWDETIEAHRLAVREAILDATWKLVTEQGLAAATMSRIAEEARIGRATLYKYFPDVEAILSGWHERHVAVHLAELAGLNDRGGNAAEKLNAMLEGYALIAHRRGLQDAELVALLHRGEHVVRAQQQLKGLIGDRLAGAAEAGIVRNDVASDELAGYCLHALAAAGNLPDEAAVRRLVGVTLSGLRPGG